VADGFAQLTVAGRDEGDVGEDRDSRN